MPILVLVSGNGTNLQALLDAEKENRLGGGVIRGVVSDRAGAFALTRAAAENIPCFTELPDTSLPREQRRRDLSDRILKRARETDAVLIILAGFLSILEGELIHAYAGRIINIHPSLLPKFGGPGMYGDRVHRAVLDSGETESGCTVHIVDEGTDTGPALLRRRVPVLPGDTPDSLAERIHREEHTAIVEAAALMAERLASGTEKVFEN
ncbi:phosphoribosylglycinamide formyltransferase [Breznakiella homolactica]|uniref:Phosphoribosylglycinamide formyltransferase n=1 Tax=Breznakiella homolactica TaxID=2798577 RepID=A0A7T7XRU2_9SPIR|nr:phosphoribosylglycinamide formyltransferase [Breznakiella homolactica]